MAVTPIGSRITSLPLLTVAHGRCVSLQTCCYAHLMCFFGVAFILGYVIFGVITPGKSRAYGVVIDLARACAAIRLCSPPPSTRSHFGVDRARV